MQLHLILDSAFIINITLAIASSCISNLRVTQNGVLITTSGGAPFLYEIWIFFTVSIFLIKVIFRKISLTKTKLQAVQGVGLLYIPIFLNALLREYYPNLFWGGGQLRLQLEALLFCLSIILGLSTTSIQRAVKFVMTATILLALINVVFAGLNCHGKVDPLYLKAIRESGRLRYSGLLDYPSRLGILCAIVFSWMIASSTKKLIKWPIILFSVAGTFYADSRTGMAAIVFSIIIASFFYVRKRVLRLWITLLLSLAGLLLILSEPQIPFGTQQDRIDRIKGALETVAKNPFGVGWAEQVLFPHNWPIMVLLTGGVISFTAVVIYHVWLLRLLREIKKFGLNTVSSLGIVLATITIASYFEQVFLEAHAILIAMFLYGVLINYTSGLKFVK